MLPSAVRLLVSAKIGFRLRFLAFGLPKLAGTASLQLYVIRFVHRDLAENGDFGSQKPLSSAL